MADQLSRAVADVTQVMQFESWLRFYFLHEEGDNLVLRLPEESLDRIRQLYPNLAPLAEELNNQPVTYESSINSVCTFVVRTFDGSKYKAGVVTRVFDSRTFQAETQLYQLWLQVHEEQLDRAFMDFSKWLELYDAWRQSDVVRQQMTEMLTKVGSVAPCTTRTQ